MKKEWQPQVGELVRYMSRIVLIVDADKDITNPDAGFNGPWMYGIEFGETEVAKYKRHVLKKLA